MIFRRPAKGPFFFVHLLKSAGTSLRAQMRGQFGRDAVYPLDSDSLGPGTTDHVLSVPMLEKCWEERKGHLRVVAGHFPLCTTDLLDADFQTLTVLRDPVERTLSFLRHCREVDPAVAGLPLEEIYEDPLQFELTVHNHMVKMFSLTVAEMTDGALTPVTFTPDRLERAKRQLETVDVVGLQADYEGFCTDLERSFGWTFGDRRHLNTSAPLAADPALERRIAADNVMDVELYEFARDLVAERGRKRRRSLFSG